MQKSANLVFLWHMHQPDYRDYATGEFVLPWTYLHAIKDYTDMAYHLERHPKIHAVINFVPVLLDQLEDYVEQFATGRFRDPLLRLLGHEEGVPLTTEHRQFLLEACFRGNHSKMLEPYPAYKRLAEVFNLMQRDGGVSLPYLSDYYMMDLVTWYHLAWCGESVRREHELVARLLGKGVGFNCKERKQLRNLIGELISGIIPRYRKLSESGQIEISSTPHYHPLSPLLIDLTSASVAMPSAPMPVAETYPGGKERVAAHIQKAQSSHNKRFGIAPTGMWPAEGAISNEMLDVMATQGCHWAASGEGVLANSMNREHGGTYHSPQHLYQGYIYNNIQGKSITCFFRDDRLSDLIGFEYSNWHGDDAANHFVARVEAIAQEAVTSEVPLVSVILDGENAWEYYPYNGFYFLDQLYTRLETHSSIRTFTYRDCLKMGASQSAALPKLVPGSWVYGNFSTWIGSADKNRAWDLLCAAKQAYDKKVSSGKLTKAEQVAAERQLCSCESSDWFWWFGDYNPSVSVVSFDRLFRHNLTELYRLLKLTPPVDLAEPISQGGVGHGVSGAMRRASD
jgi:alpha-amylase/alpha-mannosidase (GH57 family)